MLNKKSAVTKNLFTTYVLVKMSEVCTFSFSIFSSIRDLRAGLSGSTRLRLNVKNKEIYIFLYINSTRLKYFLRKFHKRQVFVSYFE